MEILVKKAMFILSISALGLALSACDVDKTQEGNVTVPEYEVKQTQEGDVTAPEYNVTPPDVDVNTQERTVEVPTIETEKKTVEVPNVDITPAPDK